MAISAKTNVEVDDTAFLAHLRDFSIVMGKSLAETIREQAGLFCIDMIRFTNPSVGKGDGMSLGSKKKGMENVEKSIYKIFQPIQRATKEEVAAIGSFEVFKMWDKRKGGFSEFSGQKKTRWTQFKAKYGGGTAPVFIEAGNVAALGAIHTAQRQDNGRGALKPSAMHSKQPFAIVAKDQDIRAYIRLKQKEVGILKSAYAFSAMKIKSKAKAAGWASNPAGAINAIGEDESQTPMLPAITVGNTKGRRGTFDSLIRSAINHRAFAMRSKMAYELNKQKSPLWLATARGQVTGSAAGFNGV